MNLDITLTQGSITITKEAKELLVDGFVFGFSLKSETYYANNNELKIRRDILKKRILKGRILLLLQELTGKIGES